MPRTNIAIMAKAPVPGLAKTRLIPTIGAHAAAMLQERMTERTAETAVAANVGPVTVWCAPDPGHASFRDLVARHPVVLKRQPEGDLGARMLAATTAEMRPVLVVGTDCPALTARHLRETAQALHDGSDVVVIPAEDGGYVLIGTRVPCPALFDNMTWGADTVLAETRRRISRLGFRLTELAALWDVDTEQDLDRMERTYPALAL